MKKLLSKIEILFFVAILFIITVIKSPNLTYENFLETIRNILFFYDKEFMFMNIISLLQYFVLVFIILKKTCYRLTHFILRYKNRKKYIFKVITDMFFMNIILSFIMIFLEGFVFLYIKGIDIDLNFSLLQMSIKLIFELFILEVILVILILITRKFTYSYLFVSIIVIICLHYVRKDYIPLVSVYLSNNFNIFLFILLVVLLMVLYFIYQVLDIGGEIDEVESN